MQKQTSHPLPSEDALLNQQIHSLRINQTNPVYFQTQPVELDLDNTEDDDGVTILSAENDKPKSKRKKKKRQKQLLEIDSKVDSVEEIRQEAPATCIVLEPEPVPKGYAINLQDTDQKSHPATAPEVQALPLEILQKMTQEANPDDICSLFSHLMQDKAVTLPEELLRHKKDAESVAAQPVQFDNLFQKQGENLTEQQRAKEALKSLAREIHNTELEQGQIMQIPKELGTIVTNKVQLIDEPKPRQICQQFLMITSADLINWQEMRFEIKKLIKSNYKEQHCQYILERLMIVDLTYNYHNVEILKMIKSRWVWDNVVPYMAECLYRDCNQLRVRLLPERCNRDMVIISKYHVFLLMAQMFLGLLPRQISTYDLPISFGEIMTVGENDSVTVINNKQSKLRCILHYFSSILREKEEKIKNCVEFISFQRFRISLKLEALYPQSQKHKLKYSNVKLTDHLELANVRHGNEFLKQTAIYLTHQNLCRQSGEQTFETPFLMQQTYRLMYSKPQIFVLRALTPKLDLGQAIIVNGLQQFSKSYWKSQQHTRQHAEEHHQDYSNRQFICDGLYNQELDLDADGKRKGSVILIMSKLLFGQSYIRNQVIRNNKITENYSVKEIKIEIQTLYSAFQSKKGQSNEEQRILVSQRYIKFIEDEYRWLYFIIVWIAASLAKVRVVFEFQKYEDKRQALLLMKNFDGSSVHELIDVLSSYRETIIEANQNWSRLVQDLTQQHMTSTFFPLFFLDILILDQMKSMFMVFCLNFSSQSDDLHYLSRMYKGDHLLMKKLGTLFDKLMYLVLQDFRDIFSKYYSIQY